MRLEIKGLAEWRERLSRVRPEEVMAHRLEEQAQRLAQTVQDNLSTPPGAGNHDNPWARTGALRASVAATASGLEATVGSSDPAAAPQEIGTSRIPPRPFFAPAASGAGQEIATSIGQAVADALGDGAAPPDLISSAMRYAVALLLVVACTPARAASPDFDRCMAAIDTAALTSSQRLDCATKDMDRADGALNAAYRETMARLSPARQSALRQEERGWIEQRRSRCALEKQEANPSRDLNRMLCLVRETDARTKLLEAMR